MTVWSVSGEEWPLKGQLYKYIVLQYTFSVDSTVIIGCWLVALTCLTYPTTALFPVVTVRAFEASSWAEGGLLYHKPTSLFLSGCGRGRIHQQRLSPRSFALGAWKRRRRFLRSQLSRGRLFARNRPYLIMWDKNAVRTSQAMLVIGLVFFSRWKASRCATCVYTTVGTFV